MKHGHCIYRSDLERACLFYSGPEANKSHEEPAWELDPKKGEPLPQSARTGIPSIRHAAIFCVCSDPNLAFDYCTLP